MSAKVTVVVPCYNAERTVARALGSLLNQTLSPKLFKIIVVNDGSTDKTLETIEGYRPRIEIIDQKNQGAVKAVNRGFKKATTPYVIKLDADDYFEPAILKKMVVILDGNPKIDFVFCDYFEKTKNGKTKTVSPKNIFQTVAEGMMFRRKRFAREGFYREDVKFSEYDLLLRIREKWRGFHLAEPLFWYIRSQKSVTGGKGWVDGAMKELEKIHPDEIDLIRRIRKY